MRRAPSRAQTTRAPSPTDAIPEPRAEDDMLALRRAHAARDVLCAAAAMRREGEDAGALPGRERVNAWLRKRGTLACGEPDPWKLAVALLRDEMGVLETHASRCTVLLHGWTVDSLLFALDLWITARTPADGGAAPRDAARQAGARVGSKRARPRKQASPQRAVLG